MAEYADRSVGYEGSVTEQDWMHIAGFGSQYGVLGDTSLAVTNVPTADRTVRVAPTEEAVWGRGILDEFRTPTQRQLDACLNGTRWDTVAVRRDRSTGESRLVVLAGNGNEAIAPGRSTFGANSQVDHQPIALVRIKAQTGTQGVIDAIRDLRCWSGDGGLTAKSALVMGYLTRPGTRVRIGGFEWSYEHNKDGVLKWTRTGVGRLLDVHPGAFFTLPVSGRYGAGTQVWGNAVQNIASVDIPDPGVPYRISAVATGFWGSEIDGTRFDLDFMAGSSLLSLWVNLGVYSGTYRRWSIDPSGEIFTGAQTVLLRARRVFGSGYGAVSVDQRNIAARVWEA